MTSAYVAVGFITLFVCYMQNNFPSLSQSGSYKRTTIPSAANFNEWTTVDDDVIAVRIRARRVLHTVDERQLSLSLSPKLLAHAHASQIFR